MARHASSAFTVRQYMLAKDFELYYYNDNDLRSVDMHRHDYLECYFFLEGKVEMIVGGQKCQPTPGDVLIVLPGTEHCLHVLDASVPYRRFVFWIGSDYLTDLTEQAEEYGHSVKREIAFLTAHSMLHLFGYDHIDDAGREEMEKLLKCCYYDTEVDF